MIIVRLVGGAKKSFGVNELQVGRSDITITDLLGELEGQRQPGLPEPDYANSLFAVNGTDSSALDGRDTVVRDGDTVSIIPVIHGGAPKKLLFEHGKRHVLAAELVALKETEGFLDGLRARHPGLAIQAVSSEFVLGASHLKKIVGISLGSEKAGVLLSRTLQADLLLRFAITTQISDAIRVAGLRPGKGFVVIAIGGRASLGKLYAEIEGDAIVPFARDRAPFLRRHFGVTKAYLGAVRSKSPLEDILAEKAAVLL